MRRAFEESLVRAPTLSISKRFFLASSHPFLNGVGGNTTDGSSHIKKDGTRSWTPFAPATNTVGSSSSTSASSSSALDRDYNPGPTPAGAMRTDRPKKPLSPEAKQWWPTSQEPAQLRQHASNLSDKDRPFNDGMYTIPLEEAPSPAEAPKLEDDGYNIRHRTLAMDTVFEHEKRLPIPATYDPAIDDVDDDMNFADANIIAELNAAIEQDRRRLEAFSNPVSVEDQLDALLTPQRYDEKSMAQRGDFNGFMHWGMLHTALIALEEHHDFKRAHQLVNRYMRDQDLFVQWLKHPKVIAHIDKKFGVDISNTYDKMMGLAMSMYVRGKIQAFEGDVGGSLKSLTACTTIIHEGGDLESNERHRKMLGAALAARGAVFVKLQSYERANEDFTKALNFVPAQRAASLFQLRAEAREHLGLIEEAREDEERAALIWERADVITPGMDGEPKKFVI